MKDVILSKEGSLKLKRLDYSLFPPDYENVPSSTLPGEWVHFINNKTNERYLGFINLFAEKNWPSGFVLEQIKNKEIINPLDFIKQKILSAYHRRKNLSLNLGGMRLISSEADGLPGLTVDIYENCILMQISTAGLDKYREDVRKIIKEIYSDKEVYFFDKQDYRKQENLPSFAAESALPLKLKVTDSSFRYEIDSHVWQKIGFYYDHQNNRKKAEETVKKYQGNKERGLDLFCYVGAWGMHLLRSGVTNVDFVDQGNFEQTIKNNITLNQLSNKGQFYRSDVFSFLDERISKGFKYDIICSDPPAFSKSIKNKEKALEGYQKLHGKCLELIDRGLFFVGSCTHNVYLNELDETVKNAAKRSSKSVYLLDCGLQNWDHPQKSFQDKSHYIKYLAYYVE